MFTIMMNQIINKEQFRYFVYKTLSKEWCDIWIKNHTKGKNI